MERHLSPHLNSPPAPQCAQALAKGGSETILLVENDPAGQAATNTLQSLGYRVLRARDAAAALGILQSGTHVDLLFTDLASPDRLHSCEFAQQARQFNPRVAVLFSSGLAPTAAGGTTDPGVEVLNTPYRQEDLALRVRHLLANQQQVNALVNALRESQREKSAAAAPTGARRPLRVLLVEDQPDVRETSRQLLELLGCRVEAVASAEAAAAALEASRFEVLVTDISLPGRSGIELARQAQRLDPAVKVVLSSGYTQPPVGGAALEGLATWNLPKPYGLAELEALLDELKQA